MSYESTNRIGDVFVDVVVLSAIDSVSSFVFDLEYGVDVGDVVLLTEVDIGLVEFEHRHFVGS